MGEKFTNYLRLHHWGIIQGLSGLYCAGLATLERLHPRATVTAQSAGGIVTSSYTMPVWLWAGIVVLALSVAIPAIRKIVRKPKPVAVHEPANDWANEQNVNFFVKLGVQTHELFTDLEMNAIQLAKNLQDFLDSHGPEPQPTEPTDSIQGLANYIGGPRSLWRSQILGGYAERFAPKVKSLANQMQIAGLPDQVLPRFSERLGDIPDIYRIQARIWIFVLRSKDINLQGEQ